MLFIFFTSLFNIRENTNSFYFTSLPEISNAEGGIFINKEFFQELGGLILENFYLQCIMIYLICLVLIIFTVKLIIDRKLYTSNLENKVLSLPLGKVINFFIKKTLQGWEMSNIFWIYFFLIFLLIFMLATTKFSYTLLLVFKIRKM